MATFTTTKSGNTSGIIPKLTSSGTAAGSNPGVFSNISISPTGSASFANSQSSGTALKPGVQASSPYQNVSKPSTTLPVGQTSTVKTAPIVNTSTTPTNSTASPYNPNAALQSGTTVTPNSQQQSPSNTGLYGQLINRQANFDPFANPTVSSAYNSAQKLNTQLEQSKYNEANAQAQNFSNPIPIGDQTGRDAVIRNQYLAQQNALAGQFQGQTNLVNAGLTGTSQQLQGLGAVTSQAPEALRYGGFGASNLDPQSRAQSLATQVKQGLISPSDAESQMSSLYGGAGSTFLNQALQGYNYVQGNAQANAQGSIVGTQQQQIAAYQSAHQQAQNLQSQLTDLITTFGLNPNDLTSVNAGIQAIASQTSNPKYQILNNYLADVASRYSQILTPAGGSATDTTRAVASGMINSLASGTSIQQVLQGLDQQAQAVISGVSTTGGNSSGQGGSSGNSGSVGWY